MKILVTGANGQLGRSLQDIAPDTNHEFIFTDVEELDITDREAVNRFVEESGVQVIVNCAAFTDVERAEDARELAEKLNAVAPGILAEAAQQNDALLIHISTDYVFGGDKGNVPRNEDIQPAPTGVYGETKLHGENKVLESGCRSVIIRTAWLYSEYGKNFVKTMLKLTAEKPELNVVFDQIGTPTYAHDLANAIVEVIDANPDKDMLGIYHFSNEGVCSWYDFTRMIAMLSGQTECIVRPCHSNEFPSKVTRPAYSVLDKTKIKDTFGITIPYWVDSLRYCLKNLCNC